MLSLDPIDVAGLNPPAFPESPAELLLLLAPVGPVALGFCTARSRLGLPRGVPQLLVVLRFALLGTFMVLDAAVVDDAHDDEKAKE